MSLNEVNYQKVLADHDSFPPDLDIIVQTSDTSCSIMRYKTLISNISCLKYMSFLLKAKIWLSQASSFHRQPLFQCKASKVQWPVDPLRRHQPRGLSEDNWLHLPQAPVQSEKRRSRIKLLVHQAGAGSAVSGRQVWVAQAGQVLWRCCGEEDNCNQCQLPAGIETKYYSVVYV